MKQYSASIFGWSKIDKAMRQTARDHMETIESPETAQKLNDRLLDIFGSDTEVNLANKINLISVEAQLQQALTLNRTSVRRSTPQLLTEKGLIPLLEHYAILEENSDKNAETQRLLFTNLMEEIATNKWNPMNQNESGSRAYRFHLRTCLSVLRLASEVLASHQDEEETQKEVGAIPFLSRDEETGLYKLCDILFDQILQPEEELSTLVYLKLETNQVRTTSTGSEIASIASKLSRYQQYRRRSGKATPISAEPEDFEIRQVRAKSEETERVLSALPESQRQTAVPVEELAIAPNWDEQEIDGAEAKADLQALRQESYDEHPSRKTANQPKGPKLGRLPENPLDWVWTSNGGQPLEYIVDYAEREIQGILETASRELGEMENSREDTFNYPLGDAAKRIFSLNSSRTNPATLWSVMGRLIAAADKEGEPTPAQFELGEENYARMVANVSIAKLHLFLDEICPKHGIDAEVFHREWSKTCTTAATEKSTKRRDELLLATLARIKPEWTQSENKWKMNQWIQDLRLQGSGGFEDSVASDRAREKLTEQVNTILDLTSAPKLHDALTTLADGWAENFDGLNQPLYANILRAAVRFLNEKGDASAQAIGRTTTDWLKGASQRCVKRTRTITEDEKKQGATIIWTTLVTVSHFDGTNRISDRQVSNNPYHRLSDTMSFLKKWSNAPGAGEMELNALRSRGQESKKEIEANTAAEAEHIEAELGGVNLEQLRAGRYLELSCDRAKMILHVKDTIVADSDKGELKTNWTQAITNALEAGTMKVASPILLKEAALTLSGTAVLARQVPDLLVRPWQVKLLKRISHRVKTRGTSAELGEENTPVKLSQAETRGVLDAAFTTGLYFSQNQERLEKMSASAETTLKKFSPIVELWKTRPDLETDVKRLVREKQSNLTQTEDARLEEILGYLNESFQKDAFLELANQNHQPADPQQNLPKREHAHAEPNL